jgi:hypothetical protein
MPGRKFNPYTFESGFVESKGVGRVIALIDKLADRGSSSSQLMKWTADGKKWSYFPLEWWATRLCVRGKPCETLFAMCPSGIVLVGSATGQTEEEVDPSLKGPGGMGDLCDMRWIGKHLYVAGMGRQVYRREGSGRWVHRDAGTGESKMAKKIRGFTAIDGLDEEDIFAVGFEGEIWRCRKGKWKSLKSPTHQVLELLRVISPTLAYAAGADGVLLRGIGDAWTLVTHRATIHEFRGMEWFRDNLYLSTEDSIYRLTQDNKLVPIKIGLRRNWTCGDLHANDGVLWSFGSKHLAWTEDLETWYDVTP